MTIAQPTSDEPEKASEADRRKHPRTKVRKPVGVVIRNCDNCRISADIVDFSPFGLCVSYQGAYLVPGRRVDVCCLWGEFSCRVVWTAAVAGSMTSGMALEGAEKQLANMLALDCPGPVQALDARSTESGRKNLPRRRPGSPTKR